MYKKILLFFSRLGTKYLTGYTAPLKNVIVKSNINMLYELYVGRMLLFSLIGFLAVFFFISFMFTYLGMFFLIAMLTGLIGGITTFFIFLTLFHSYPYQLLSSQKSNIEANLPFAANHMAAISASGVPPFMIFKLLSTIPEYREITNECKRITRNIDVFGMDIISATKNVADRTPSEEFKVFLYGFIESIEGGGDLKRYIEASAKDMMFDYRLKREKYLQTLSTYADVYTAVLIAAPLFFISILSIMSLIGGEVMGMSIPFAMKMGTYVMIPLMNIIFIMFINFTQPSM